MQTVQPQLIQNKTVLLRLDLDVPLRQVQGRLEVEDDFRLEAGLDTLDLCLQYAGSVVIMGHIGRPGGKEVAELSVKPVADWFEERF
ncbi:MAG: phosphoglycerate kinase, partial [Candidatus Bathyarchaeota archaeon]|nr:phosphoglycerate kinase [Candidatus Bathyarchaeota archaeon]